MLLLEDFSGERINWRLVYVLVGVHVHRTNLLWVLETLFHRQLPVENFNFWVIFHRVVMDVDVHVEVLGFELIV